MWDPIQGVGKTPLITESIAQNPYSLSGEEITNLWYISQTIGSTSSTGSVLSLTDPFYDYVGSPAVVWSQTMGLGVNTTNTLVCDLGKEVIFRGISIYFDWASATPTTVHFYLETSRDGITWTVQKQEDYVSVTGGGALTYQSNSAQARYVRFRANFVYAGSGGTTTVNLRKLRGWLDAKQTFY